jgi:hypothetical protein
MGTHPAFHLGGCVILFWLIDSQNWALSMPKDHFGLNDPYVTGNMAIKSGSTPLSLYNSNRFGYTCGKQVGELYLMSYKKATIRAAHIGILMVSSP